MDSITLVVRTIGELYVFAIVLRFILQLSNADYYNPISQTIARLTNTPILAMSRILPRVGGVDISAILYAIIIKTIVIILLLKLSGMVTDFSLLWLRILGYAIIGTLNTVLELYFWAVLAAVIISWIAPGSYQPAPQLIQQITEPIFSLVQKVLPPIGGLDLSPILIFLVIRGVQMQLAPFLIP